MKKRSFLSFSRKTVSQLIIIGALAACSTGSGDPLEDATVAMEAQDYRSARIHLMTLLRENSQDPQANFLFGKTMVELGDGLAAESALRKLMGNAEYEGQAKSWLGRSLLLNGKAEEALKLAENPSGKFAAKISAVKIMSLLSLNRDEEALTILDKAIAQYPDDGELQWIKGNRALQVGDLNTASASAKLALEKQPESMEALMLAGRLALAKADGRKALQHFKKVRDIRPDNITAEYLRGAVYKNLGERVEARNCFKTVLSASPNHPWATYFLAQMDYDEGKSDEAFERLQSFKGDLNEVAPALRLAGILEVRRGNYEQSIDHLNRYVAQNPPDAPALVALSKALSGAGNKREAYRAIVPLAQSITAPVDALEHAAKLASAAGSGTAQDYTSRAQALKSDSDKNSIFEAEQTIIAQDWEQAAVIYDKLLKKDHPQKVMLLNNAAMVQFNLGQGDKAIKLARQAQQAAPGDPMVKDTLGWVLLQTGKDKVEALQLLKEAAVGVPGDPEILWHLANALAANGENEDARKVAVNLKQIAKGKQKTQLDNLLTWI